MLLVAAICGVALLAWLWWAGRKPQSLGAGELHRLRRIAETVRRDQAQPFD